MGKYYVRIEQNSNIPRKKKKKKKKKKTTHTHKQTNTTQKRNSPHGTSSATVLEILCGREDGDKVHIQQIKVVASCRN